MSVTTGIYLECNNCGRIWKYKGSSKRYTTCPKCLYKVNVTKSLVNKFEDV